jgi:hypothetical protein
MRCSLMVQTNFRRIWRSASILNLILASTASAEMPAFVLHATEPNQRRACSVRSLHVSTSARLLPSAYYVYVLLGRERQTPPQIGCQFGVNYETAAGRGIEVYGWQLCASREVPTLDWPGPGSGNTIVWDPSQRHESVLLEASDYVAQVAGYFYCGGYTPSAFHLTADPRSGDIQYAGESESGAVEADPDSQPAAFLGRVQFSADGASIGHDPTSGREGLPAGRGRSPHLEVLSVSYESQNERLSLKFRSSSVADVQIEVLDIQGRLIGSVWQGTVQEGSNSLVISLLPGEVPSRLSSGVYFARLTGPGHSATSKFLLVR